MNKEQFEGAIGKAHEAIDDIEMPDPILDSVNDVLFSLMMRLSLRIAIEKDTQTLEHLTEGHRLLALARHELMLPRLSATLASA